VDAGAFARQDAVQCGVGFGLRGEAAAAHGLAPAVEGGEVDGEGPAAMPPVDECGAAGAELSLRIDRDLDGALRRRAALEQISPSALVRRLLRAGLGEGNEPILTARQVMRESA
jgi:hypothetical protein